MLGRSWILGCVGVLALALPVSSPASGRGRAARSVNLTESAQLHLASRHGLQLNEQGSVSGTIDGTIYIHLNETSRRSVLADVEVHASGGSLTGAGSAGYRLLGGGRAEFSGGLSITRGTGGYAHARAHNLRFTGSIQLSNDAVNATLSGPLSY